MKLLDLEVTAFNRIAQPYRLPLDDVGLCLVEGERLDAGDVFDSNGAGKSLSIVETLTWCLWEKFVRHGSAKVTDAAVHPTRGADVAVSLEKQGVRYQVRRTRAPSGGATLRLSIWDGSAWVPLDQSKDASHRVQTVEGLLGMDYETFCYSVVVQGADAFAEDGFPKQMAVIESLLQMDELSTAAETARKQATQLDRELAADRAELRAHEQALAGAEETLSDITTQVQAADAQVAEDRTRLRKELKVAREGVGLAKTLAAEVTTLQATIDAARAEAADLNAASSPLMAEKGRVEKQVTSLVCAECKRPFGSPEETAKKQEAASKRLVKVTTELDALATRRRTAQQTDASTQVRLREREGQLRMAQRVADAALGIEQQLKQLDAHRALLTAQQTTVEAQVKKVKEAVRAATKQVAARAPVLTRKQAWVTGFGRDGLQADLFAGGLPELNRASERYSTALAGDALRVSFETRREVARQQLVRLEGASAPTYAGCSRGEKEKINLIVALSLRALARWRAGEEINLTTYDEVFDHIDPAGLRAVTSLLQQEVLARNSTTFVLTHNPTLKALFPGAHLVRVVREKGEATVSFS